jgi:anaerobic selenocysteine-containing dehydrogenase
MTKVRLSRRRFIKRGLAGFAFLATGASPIPGAYADKKSQAVSRTSLKNLLGIPTTCEQCPAGCGIIAYLDGDRLVQILGNPAHPNNKGSICAKGIAGINLVNDPERLLYPLKRLGPRGSGRWTTITWDEAYTILSQRIKELIARGKINELVLDKGRNNSLLDHFLHTLGSPHVIDRQTLKSRNRDIALLAMTGSPLFIEDVSRSRTILNFGANPYANHDHFLGMAKRLVLARVERGAKLVTFDVRMSETAAKSDTWYPLKAGTDGIVALAMANVIMENDLEDKKFINQKTNYTSSEIRYYLSHFSPEFAERESGVRAEDIEKLAVEFAFQKPSVAIIGGGASEHVNGSQNVRCIALLNWLVGNLEKDGGLFFPRIFGPDKGEAAYRLENMLSSNEIRGILDLRQTQTRVDTYFAYLANPAYEDPDCQSAARLLKDEKYIPFLVVMDTHLTETGMIADMILPSATYLEEWGLSHAPSLDRIPIINLKQPVVSLLSTARILRSPAFEMGKLLEPTFRPRGEAKEVGNLCLELAKRIGGDVAESLPFRNTREYITEVLSSISGLKGLQALRRQGLWIDKDSQRVKNAQPKVKESLSKSNQKVQIYSRDLKQYGHSALPEYQAIDLHKKMKKGEFILTTFKSNLSCYGTSNSKWAREILHDNPLWINRQAAEKLGIKNGERIRVISSIGTLVVRALTTDRIHPKSVAIAQGLGHTGIGNVARAKRFKSRDRDTDLIWWKKEGSGVNPNKIISTMADPLGQGYALKDTVVRIEKLGIS